MVERELWAAGGQIVVGVDEVGRGAWAGPISVGAFVTPHDRRVYKIRDSKMLTESEREALFDRVTSWAVAWSVGHASPAECDDMGMSDAQRLAARRAISGLGVAADHVLVDGLKIKGIEDHIGPYTAIVHGDASSYAIACASVIAKVTRDRLMARLALRYPGYGWEHNAGYATRDHVAGLRELGITPFHRRTYQRIRAILEGDQLAFDLVGDTPPA